MRIRSNELTTSRLREKAACWLMRAARFFFFFPAPLLLALKAGVRKLFFFFPTFLSFTFYNPICKGELQTCWRKDEAFADEWNKTAEKCSFGSAVRFRANNGVWEKHCLLFFLLHRTGKKKESPICLAAGELNESFYGLSNLGEWERGTCNNISFNPGKLGSGLVSVVVLFVFSSGGRRGAGGRISRGSSGVQAWIRPTAAAGRSGFRFTAYFWHLKCSNVAVFILLSMKHTRTCLCS